MTPFFLSVFPALRDLSKASRSGYRKQNERSVGLLNVPQSKPKLLRRRKPWIYFAWPGQSRALTRLMLRLTVSEESQI